MFGRLGESTNNCWQLWTASSDERYRRRSLPRSRRHRRIRRGTSRLRPSRLLLNPLHQRRAHLRSNHRIESVITSRIASTSSAPRSGSVLSRLSSATSSGPRGSDDRHREELAGPVVTILQIDLAAGSQAFPEHSSHPAEGGALSIWEFESSDISSGEPELPRSAMSSEQDSESERLAGGDSPVCSTSSRRLLRMTIKAAQPHCSSDRSAGG